MKQVIIDVEYSAGTCEVQQWVDGVDVLVNDRDAMHAEEGANGADAELVRQALGHMAQMDKAVNALEARHRELRKNDAANDYWDGSGGVEHALSELLEHFA